MKWTECFEIDGVGLCVNYDWPTVLAAFSPLLPVFIAECVMMSLILWRVAHNSYSDGPKE